MVHEISIKDFYGTAKYHTICVEVVHAYGVT